MIKGSKVIHGQILNRIKWFYISYMLAFAKTCKNSSRWPLCPTFRYGVKGQKIWIISNNVKLQIVQGQRLNINNGCVPVISDDSSLVTLSEYPTGSCILLVSFFLSFFLLATLPRLISLTCLDRFQPNLVTRTPDPWHLCHMIRVGSNVTQGSKRSFH